METESVWHKSTFYIAVLIYESSSDAAGYEPLYEESFMVISADSDEEAREKALRHASTPYSYKNEYGETITWSFKQLVSVQSALNDQFSDGAEIYARHFRNYEAYHSAFLVPFPDS